MGYTKHSDFARIVYNIQSETPVTATQSGGAGPGSQVYFADNFSLTNSVRAMQVARGFQEYRISKIEMFAKPVADTFVADNVADVAGRSVPYFYYLIDKTGALTNSSTTTKTLRQAGAKPHRLDDKIIYASWKPSVLVASNDATPAGPMPLTELSALHKISPWITTNANSSQQGAAWAPNSVDHYGIAFGAEQARGTLDTIVAYVSFRLTFEFRKPLWYDGSIPINPPIRLVLDEEQPEPLSPAKEGELLP